MVKIDLPLKPRSGPKSSQFIVRIYGNTLRVTIRSMHDKCVLSYPDLQQKMETYIFLPHLTLL